jgi:hypothetical protein
MIEYARAVKVIPRVLPLCCRDLTLLALNRYQFCDSGLDDADVTADSCW